MDANIIKKLQGLFSKTVENGCSVAEASSAAAKAQQLLDQYKLSMVDVIGFDNEDIETFTVSSFSGERSITWKERLVNSLAKIMTLRCISLQSVIHKSQLPINL